MSDVEAWPLHYWKNGDERPPAAELLHWGEVFSQSRRPRDLNLLADVAIDLAMIDSANSGLYIATAREALDEVILRTTTAEAEGKTDIARSLAPHAVKAFLRRSELPAWQQAAEGAEIRLDYGEILDAAIQANKYAQGNESSEAEVRAFVLIILGLRDRGSGESWVGRSALAREGSRPKQVKEGLEYSYNWLFGLADGTDPTSYVDPALKLQVKRYGKDNPTLRAHKRAGIPMLSAEDFGFHDQALVIEACSAEREPYADTTDGAVLGSKKLDEITKSLGQYLRFLKQSTVKQVTS